MLLRRNGGKKGSKNYREFFRAIKIQGIGSVSVQFEIIQKSLENTCYGSIANLQTPAQAVAEFIKCERLTMNIGLAILQDMRTV